MLEDITIYKDTKRNDKCPCGSGKIFKQCCMESYRKVKKNGGSKAILSTYSPINPLKNSEKQAFTEFYTQLMIFSNQYRNKIEYTTIESIKESIQSFISKEREHFYKNHLTIIEQYIDTKNPTLEDLMILDGLKSAKFDSFFLLSFSDNTAIIMDKNEKFYNIQALNSHFKEIFHKQEKYLGIQTALIPYKNRYITDGIFQVGSVPKELYKYFDSLPYQNPTILYTQDDKILNFPFAITFSIGSLVDHFKKTEELLLKKVPNEFTFGLLEEFRTDFALSTDLISSFLRTTDFLQLLEEENRKTLSYIAGALPVTNFENGNKDEIIPYELLEYYYKQVPIEQSVSFNVYNKQKKVDPLFKMFQSFSTFYTLLGVVAIKEKDLENFSLFIETFKTQEKREILATKIEQLCEEFSLELGSSIEPVFVDVALNLDEIYDQISDYYHYVQNQPIQNFYSVQQYSRTRGQ